MRRDPDDSNVISGVFQIVHEPPLRLGIVAGEAVQQYRSSLDHLATRLARLRRPGITKSANFPVATSRERWTQPPAPKKKSLRDLARPNFRPADFALIEAVQPYNSPVPASHPLAVITALSNLDKHESIISRKMVWTNVEEFHDAWGDVEVLNSIRPGEPIEDGTELIRVRTRNPEMNVRVWVRIVAGVRFGNDNIGHDRFVGLGREIVRIIDKFEDAIPELRPS